MKKIVDTYFFSYQDYAPFLSYGPFKNMDEILLALFSKTFEARALKPSE